MDRGALGAVDGALGDNNEAIRWLEAAYQTRFSWMPWIEKDAGLPGGLFYPLHGGPRFQDLLRRIRIAASHP
jgi:hypothetical protein